MAFTTSWDQQPLRKDVTLRYLLGTFSAENNFARGGWVEFRGITFPICHFRVFQNCQFKLRSGGFWILIGQSFLMSKACVQPWYPPVLKSRWTSSWCARNYHKPCFTYHIYNTRVTEWQACYYGNKIIHVSDMSCNLDTFLMRHINLSL